MNCSLIIKKGSLGFVQKIKKGKIILNIDDNNKRICNSDTSVGGGDYLFQFNHEDATVDATLKLIVYIDQSFRYPGF